MISILIIVPTKNSTKYLKKFVKSLLDQEDPNWRVIFVDYNSEKFHNDYLKNLCHLDKRFNIKKQIGHIVEIHMRTTKNGSVSHRGMVTEIDVNRPNRVKTNTCPRYFRQVLKLIYRPSTRMSSISSQSDSECAISQYF